MEWDKFLSTSCDVADLDQYLHVPIGLLRDSVGPVRLTQLLRFTIQAGVDRGRPERVAVYNDILPGAGTQYPPSAPLHWVVSAPALN